MGIRDLFGKALLPSRVIGGAVQQAIATAVQTYDVRLNYQSKTDITFTPGGWLGPVLGKCHLTIENTGVIDPVVSKKAGAETIDLDKD